MTAWIQLMRPRQWIKNGIVLVGVVFAGRLAEIEYLSHALLAFVTFCLLSSAIYVFNDLVDIEKDRLHPEKRTRPLASGAVGPRAARFMSFGLAVAGLAMAFALGPRFGVTAVSFILLNVLYSLLLKRHVIIDVMSISVSFMIRAIGGVEVLRDLDPDVALSAWLLLCTFFLALFMAFGKRRSELVLLDEDASGHREALGDYSVEFLDTIIPMVTSCAIVAFTVYTIWPETVEKLGTDKLVYTVPLVVYGFFRYLFLIRERGLGGNPSEILFHDRPLLACVVGWMTAVVGLLYFR